jgi:hypothetical protein
MHGLVAYSQHAAGRNHLRRGPADRDGNLPVADVERAGAMMLVQAAIDGLEPVGMAISPAVSRPGGAGTLAISNAMNRTLRAPGGPSPAGASRDWLRSENRPQGTDKAPRGEHSAGSS